MSLVLCQSPCSASNRQWIEMRDIYSISARSPQDPSRPCTIASVKLGLNSLAGRAQTTAERAPAS